MTKKPLFDDEELFYLNNEGFMVFTSAYLLQRGYCCGNGCMHCPFEYKAVSNELRRKKLIEEQKNEMQREPNWVNTIYDIVREIPHGKVTTYGFIADLVGARTTARMVGWAMNKSHHQVPPVPAHRVVNRNGMLSGRMHFATPDTMQQLLEQEGLEIKNNQIINFENHLWRPK